MKKSILSIIIPIKISEFNTFIYGRLKRFFDYFILNPSIEVVVVDSSSSERYQGAIKDIVLSNFVNSKYCYIEINEPYSAAKARNRGSELASGDYLIFFDIDLLSHQDFFIKVLEDVEKVGQISSLAFTIYPCLYLTESFSNHLELMLSKDGFNEEDVKEIALSITKAKHECLIGKKTKVLYPAINTSTILVNRQHFLDVGGYFEGFKGHGYEDFFLLHILSYYYPLAKKGKDYALDYKTDYPGLYLGFRQYYAYYALDNLFRKRYTVHLYHNRSKKRIYYHKRNDNSLLFQNKLNELGNKTINNSFIVIDNYQKYINELFFEYGYSRKQTSGFYRPYLDDGVRGKIYRIYRKLRKLILKPRAFFTDIRLDKYLR